MVPLGLGKQESVEPDGPSRRQRPEWAGPHETRGLDRALEVGQGKKLGIFKHLDGDTPPPPPPGPPPVTPPPDRGHTSPAIEGPPPHEFQLFFYHGDHLGSSNVITDAFAGVFEHVEYFPFGEPWVDDGGTATLLPYKFTSKELDPETGLYYYGARYYEPRLQRWLSPDALESVLRVGVPPAHNPYQYTLWNPLRFVDPTGLEEEQPWTSRVWEYLTHPLESLEKLKEHLAEQFGKATGEDIEQRRLRKHSELSEAEQVLFGAETQQELTREIAEATREEATQKAKTVLDVAEALAPVPVVGRVGKGTRSARAAERESVLVGKSVGAAEGIFRGSKITKELAKELGIERRQLGKAIESIKGAWGLRGNENVQIGRATGDVWDKAGNYLGNVFNELVK